MAKNPPNKTTSTKPKDTVKAPAPTATASPEAQKAADETIAALSSDAVEAAPAEPNVITLGTFDLTTSARQHCELIVPNGTPFADRIDRDADSLLPGDMITFGSNTLIVSTVPAVHAGPNRAWVFVFDCEHSAIAFSGPATVTRNVFDDAK